MRSRILVGLAVAGLAAMSVAAPATAATSDDATLSVLHGIPDTPVDVYVDGDLTLDDFQPGDLAGPLELPAGDYDVALTATDAEDDSDPVLGPITLTLESGTSYTAVAHLTADGEPTADLFTNDTSETAAGEGRLTLRHVAAAPAVDVLAGDSPVIEGLENPDEATLDLPAGTVSAAVALVGTTDPVLGPTDVEIADGTLTILYAWGSAEDDNLAIAAQTIDGLHSGPDGVNTGSAGLVAEDRGAVWTPVLLGGAALLVAALVVVAVRRTSASRSR